MDRILRVTAGNGSVRAFIADTRQTVDYATKIHHLTPVCAAALGRSLTACGIMGTMLKNESDLVTISVKGDGPMGGLTVTGDNKGRVKGYVNNPNADVPLKPNGKLNVRDAVGCGTMTIIKDLGLKEPYVGQTPLVSGEIADDITYYYAKSEQIPSAVALGVLVDRDYSIKYAGGFIIQLMPDAEEEIITKLENKMAHLPPFTMLMEKMSLEDIVKEILGEMDYNILDELPVSYYCNCSKKRVEKALITIGKEEITKIIEEDKKANLHCHFCNTDYEFSEAELKNIVNKL